MIYLILWSLCSDDELTPYDMSDDQEMSAASPPRYLRDCLESTAIQDLFGPHLLQPRFAEAITDMFSSIHIALISSEDPMRVELSLIAAEDLVRKNVFAAREVWQPHLEFSSMRATPNLFITLDDVCFPD